MDHVAHPGHPARLARRRPRLRMILAIETRCDETSAAVVTRRAGRSPTSCPARSCSTRYGGVVPEPPRATLERVNAVVDEALARGGPDRRRRRGVAVTRAPAWSARCSSASRPRRGSRARRMPLAPVDHLRGTSTPTPRARGDQAAVPMPVASGGHTLISRVQRARAAPRCSGGRSTTRPARHSTRGRGCSASAIRAGRRRRKLALQGDRGGGRGAEAGRGAGWTSRRGPQDRGAVRGARLGGRPRAGSRTRRRLQARVVETLMIRVALALGRGGLRSHRHRRRRRRQQGSAARRWRPSARAVGSHSSFPAFASSAPTTRR